MAGLQQFCIRCLKYIPTTNYVCKNGFHRSSILLDDLGKNVREALFVPFQKEKIKKTRKVTVVGASGKVGSAICYNLFIGNHCDEIVMVDRKESEKRLNGEALDIIHSSSIRKSPKIIFSLDYKVTENSDLIIICSGAQPTKDQSLADVAQTNVDHFKDIIPRAAKLSPDSVMLVLSNPVDILTYAACKYSCFDINRVMGCGSELDTARFRFHISKRLGINARSVGGWIIGEHGKSSVPVWSSVDVSGCRLRDIDPKIGGCEDPNQWNELHKQVIKDTEIIRKMKGFTNWGMSFIVERVANAVLNDSETIHGISTQIKGLHGICTDCFMSLPCIVGNRGVKKIIKQCLCEDEVEKLNESACALDEQMKAIKF